MNGNALFDTPVRSGLLARGLIFLALIAALAASGTTASAEETYHDLSTLTISEHITAGTIEMGDVVAVKTGPPYGPPTISHEHELDFYNADISGYDSVAAGFSDTAGSVYKNTLNISYGAVSGDRYVAGGAIIGSGAGTLSVEENTVWVSGVYTGAGVLAGGMAVTGGGSRAEAVKNSVVFSAGSENYGDSWDVIYGAMITGSGDAGGGEGKAELGNTVTIDGKGGDAHDAIKLGEVDWLIGGEVGVGVAGDSARNNSVKVIGIQGDSTLNGSFVAGGSIGHGDGTEEINLVVSDNFVRLEWGSYGYISGGLANASDFVTVSHNDVELAGTVTVRGDVAGGRATFEGDNRPINVIGNSVAINISDAGTIIGNVYGGYIYTGMVNSNSVTVTRGTVTGSLIGGYRRGSQVSGIQRAAIGNTVSINTTGADAGKVEVSDVKGSWIPNGKADFNKVEILTGNHAVTVSGYIFGAHITTGTAEYNSVEITTGAEDFTLATGYANSVSGVTFERDGIATGNSVLVKLGAGSAMFGNVTLFGASERGNISNGLTGNSVEIYCLEQGCASKAATGDIYGAASTGRGEVTGNWVTVAASAETGIIYGAATTDTMASGAASGNRVTVAASAEIGGAVGGLSGFDDAFRNSVTLSKGVTVSGDVIGGAAGGDAYRNEIAIFDSALSGSSSRAVGGLSSNGGDASFNELTVANSTVAASLFGGISENGVGTAVNNTVTLSGTMLIDPAATVLAGGRTEAGGDGFTGNKLVLDHLENDGHFGTISGVQRFEIYATAARAMEATDPANRPLLPADVVTFGDGVTTGKSDIAIALSGSGRLSSGDIVYLSKTAVNGTAADIGTVTITQPFVSYAVSVADIAATHGIEILEASVTDEAKALSELPLAVVSFVNRGSDLIANQAIPAAVAAASPGLGASAFANVSYGWHRSETGSHVDVKGTNGDVGVAFETETSFGTLAAGAFLEFGDGSFDSYNEFANLASVHGEGDLSYLGGGAFVRFDAGPTDSSRPFAEASVRFGKAEADFRTRDFSFSPGTEVSYGLDAKYWGFHAGAGYVFDFSDRGFDGTLEVSAKYFHVRREGDDFRVNDVAASLSAVTSSRAVVGARLSARFTSSVKGYFGLYFEREFDGDSRVFYDGLPIPEVSLGGSSGIGELGLAVSSPESPLEVRMGIQGSVGRRDGISASLSVMYTF